ncbi:hypothetical protein GF420_12240, partial [candidate division GN15 bacterium]|nr:hypothetical protein [candidate division GN15 bacterium]
MRALRGRADGRAGSNLCACHRPADRSRRKKKAPALAGKHILVTAGPCREAIDPVRYISNRSSGKMGYALAAAARDAGATVTLVSGPTGLVSPPGVDIEHVETTEQMHAAVARHFQRCDCLIMAAAPADYRPKESAENKIKKSADARSLELTPTVDILRDMAGRKRPG